MMNKSQILQKTAKYVEKTLKDQEKGHDFSHIRRVWENSKEIGKAEKADLFIVELGALLHDIADWKFSGGDLEAGPRAAQAWLKELKLDQEVIDVVSDIVRNVSYTGAGEASKMKTLEGKVVQDADRLDALGAVGIARAFSYGGHKNREMYNPQIKPVLHKNFEEYKNSNGTTINHFYEKLLLLKARMNTKTGKKFAEGRDRYMRQFLKKFYEEWNGKEK